MSRMFPIQLVLLLENIKTTLLTFIVCHAFFLCCKNDAWKRVILNHFVVFSLQNEWKTLQLVVGHCHSPRRPLVRYMPTFPPPQGVWLHTSVKMKWPVQISLPPYSYFTMLLYACFCGGQQTFRPRRFSYTSCMNVVVCQDDICNSTWSCWCIRAYLSSERKVGQVLSSHWPYTEQQRESQRKW